MKTLESWHGPAYYEIKVNGCLGSHWSDWFDGMKIQSQGSVTTLIGLISDQPALHGLLMRIRDLNLILISVKRIGFNRKIKEKRYR